MPELPEVETTCRGISPFLLNETIIEVIIRQPKLRKEIPADLGSLCVGQTIQAVKRRAKYLVIELTQGYLLNHLGMSGRLAIVPSTTPINKHDHFELKLSNGFHLRYTDPRRFGLWTYTRECLEQHPLLAHLGPEPLSTDFHAAYLVEQAKGKKQAIKSFIMTNEVVVGVGNIYATESLFLAGIHPLTPAGQLHLAQWESLVSHIQVVLQQAIDAGGTTLRDFFASDGKPGYFSQHLQVYGRKQLPCFCCQTPIQTIGIAGRASAFCPRCQILS